MIVEEYPYTGTINRIVTTQADNGDIAETTKEIYSGEMDFSLQNDKNGIVAQTSSYIVSIPLILGSDNKYNIPHKDDIITVDNYGESINLKVDNAIPSQLGGITIYATRGDWNNGN